MRHRWYDFILAVIVGSCIIGYLVWGGEGWAWMGFMFTLGWLRYFTFILQMIAYSCKFIAGELGLSTNGKPFAHCDALGEKEIEVEVTKLLKPQDANQKDLNPVPMTFKTKVKVAAIPKVLFFEGGTGELGLAKKYGGRELGFYIVDERLLMNLGKKGNLAALSHEWTMSPQKRQLVALLRRIKPTPNDERQVIFPEWWAILNKHKRFTANAPVHVFIDPMYPMIYKDELGDMTLMLPGLDREKDCILPCEVRLRDLIGDGPIIALMPEFIDKVNGETARAAREWAGREIHKREEMIEYLEGELAKVRRMNESGTGQPAITEQIITTVAGPDDVGQRMG